MSRMKLAAMAAVAMSATLAMAQGDYGNGMNGQTGMHSDRYNMNYTWGQRMSRQQLLMWTCDSVRASDQWTLQDMLSRMNSSDEDLVLQAISNAINDNRVQAMTLIPADTTTSETTTTTTAGATTGTATTTTTSTTSTTARDETMSGYSFDHPMRDYEAYNLLFKDLNATDRSALAEQWMWMTSSQQMAILDVVKDSADVDSWRSYVYHTNSAGH